MLILECLKMAWASIRANKVRSFLTMLGVIIGVSSVIAIVSIGDTMRSVVEEQYESIGMNRAMVYVYNVEYYTNEDLFSVDEMERIKDAFGDRLAYIRPSFTDRAEIANGRKSAEIYMEAVSDGYLAVHPMTILYGRMIDQGDVQGGKNHIVLEASVAQELFGQENCVGQKVRMTYGEELFDYLVVGVYEKKQTFMDAMGGSGRETMYVPYSAIFGPDGTFWDLDVYTAIDADTELIRSQMVKMISRMKNRSEENIMYYSVEEDMAFMETMMDGMTGAVIAIASISLVVGGIGIMNIMLVSVTERTREIGIRKALGAKTRDILLQFLIEAGLLSAAGGLIGTLLGLGVVALGGALIGLTVTINPMIVIAAVAFSALVGMFFGMWPAKKAANYDPIDALRYE